MKKARSRMLSFCLAAVMVLVPAMYAIGFSAAGVETNAEALDLPVMQEKNGSFKIEVEDMKRIEPMRLCDGGESASGGKYVDTEPGGYARADDPATIPEPLLRAKFKVDKPGKYKLTMRVWADDGNSDSVWWTIDDSTYLRANCSAKPEWGWLASPTNDVIEAGWHTLDIKYREAGLKMDVIYLIPAEVTHTQKWFGSFPGEEPEMTPEEKAIKKVELNGTRLAFDVLSIVKDGVMYSSFEGMAYYVGADVTISENGGFTATRYSKSVSGSMDKSALTANGKTIEMPSKPFIERNRIFVSTKEFFEAFGASVKWDEKNNLTAVTMEIEPDPVWPEAGETEITVNPYYREASYSIPYQNPDAKVEIFVRNKNSLFWSKGYEPFYKDGAFVGSLANLYDNSDFILRVKITENGAEKNMMKPFKTKDGKSRTLEDVAYNPEGLLLVPTFENISYYIQSPKDGAKCWVRYREVGKTDWQNAFTPYYDAKLKQFRGSIVELKEDTEYEVCARVIVDGRVAEDKTEVIKTLGAELPVAKEIDIKELYTPGKPVIIYNMSGSPDGWIKIKGDGKTVIDVPDEYDEAILVAESKYIIFDNLLVDGARIHGMNVGAGSSDIRIQNCEIFGWGRVGNYDPSDGCYKTPNNTRINNDAGIRLNDVSNTVVERCYIRDPNGRSNAWTGPTWVSIHPAGPNAIYMRGQFGNVIRYNDFIGSDEHRWNDVIETHENSNPYGGVGSDSDVYGNIFMFGQDDSTELDGGQINTRFFRNKVEGFLCGVSTAATVAGPSYLYRNLITNLGDEFGKTGSAFKTGWSSSTPVSIGLNYYFFNTVIAGAGINETSGYHNPYSRNNIFETNSKTGNAASAITSDSPLVSLDYDLYFGVVKNRNDFERNGIFGRAAFMDKDGADYRLAKGSLGIDDGQWIDNFSAGKKGVLGFAPDMGAIEYGDDVLLPERPIDIRASKYQINLKNSKTSDTITFKIGNVPKGTKYSVRQNSVFDWFLVEGAGCETSGELTPNSTLTFKITGMADKVEYARGNGAFTLRLENGLSVPVSVYLDK